MTQASLTRSVKQALVRSLREDRELFRDLLAEVIEDVSLVNAIREGEKTRPVKRETVMKLAGFCGLSAAGAPTGGSGGRQRIRR